ncbi:glycosyltransferase family 4 protein [Sphingobacterium chuzhouense]|uniref:Glycosyltransferase family 4 protein n=1 Tax=Sphingobacterium chuzhouense TaxID=1742264 RepID=A0ABR7XR75_9SPHI|nr:glycosyltransferase family 4 protein [Sphingobacterium chuzhouense]MBD1421643.1 glycosyltransferase family 4 protein [Sphingobacterium chuzhouense]
MKIAIIGTYPPRQCGIATFTHDTYKSLLQTGACYPSVVSIADGSESSFPSEVKHVILRDQLNSYIEAARFINNTFDICIIQHEYGIFGGEAGSHILTLAQQLDIPIVCNFHTVLKEPSKEEKKTLQQLARVSQQITVMTQYAIKMLKQIYEIPGDKIAHIPHGVPTFDYQQEKAKRALGLTDKKIMLSFGFLGKNKGFETAIEAVSHVKDQDFQYIILGTTHPNVLKESGESYREQLQQKAEELGIGSKINFINCFASEDLLVQYLSACDIYVTPYPNEQQISSGTLSFALGAGAAVISTPYWYAKDLLAHKRGLLFDFRDSQGLSKIINQLLDNPDLLRFYRKNAAQYGKKMSWSTIGFRQLVLLQEILDKQTETQPSVTFSDLPEKLSAMLTTTQKKLSY